MSASIFLRHCALGDVYSGLEYNVFIPTLCIRVILKYLLNFKRNKHWKLLCFLQIICFIWSYQDCNIAHFEYTHICKQELPQQSEFWQLTLCIIFLLCKKKLQGSPTNFLELSFGWKPQKPSKWSELRSLFILFPKVSNRLPCSNP